MRLLVGLVGSRPTTGFPPKKGRNTSHSRIKTLRDFQFLPLLLQNLPPFDPPLGVEIPFFDLDLHFPSKIDGFPIENALSQFLSDVVPRFLHAREGTSMDSSSRNRELERFRFGSAAISISVRRDDDSWEEENRESWECSGAGADAVDVLDQVVDFLHEEKTVEKYSDSVTKTPMSQRSKLQKELRFEIVEIELPRRETMSSCEAEEAGFCFELSNIKILLRASKEQCESKTPSNEQMAFQIAVKTAAISIKIGL
ncbi:uncharacterized protein [Elaeis guineensis]|uniref:Uncharacterized protein LOC105055237 n=1 Tax=Elaeis guineensis var. tenera TaxID=51953 RepID=A0A6I9S144_ELAGV|nr:uncharacterized protein LOC105055237 [Elaeis guineensis]